MFQSYLTVDSLLILGRMFGGHLRVYPICIRNVITVSTINLKSLFIAFSAYETAAYNHRCNQRHENAEVIEIVTRRGLFDIESQIFGRQVGDEKTML